MAFQPGVEHLKLTDELKTYRVAAGYEHAVEVDRCLGWGRTKTAKIEAGKASIKEEDLEEFLMLYHVPDTERERLRGLLQRKRSGQWWNSFEHVLTPAMRRFIEYENSAQSILLWSPAIMPGITQERAYADAIFEQSYVAKKTAVYREEHLEIRRHRNLRITSTPPPDLCLFLGEAALHNAFGNTVALQEQRVYLREICELPNVQLRISTFDESGIPHDLGLYSHAQVGKIVAVDSFMAVNIRDDVRSLADAERALSLLDKKTLSHRRSVQLLEKKIGKKK